MELPIQVIFKDEPGVAIAFPNHVTEDLPLTHVEGNRYRLNFSSLLAEPRVFYGDVIEIKPTGEKSADFLRIVKRSGLRVSCRVIGKDIIDSPLLQHVLEQIMQLGGNWERAFGGVLLVHLPESVELDLDAALQAIGESC
jgi:hypothetical protein